MFKILAYAEPNRSGGSGRAVSSPSRPTSVQGRVYAQYGNSFIANRNGRGRPQNIQYVQPSRTRGRRA